MNALKHSLVSPPVLAFPNSTGYTTLDTNTCSKQVGCVFLQKLEEETKQTLGYWYRSLDNAEEKFDASQKKCLGVIWSVLILRLFLKRTQFTMRTDQDSLKWILNLTDSTGRLERWRIRLSEYGFDVVHGCDITPSRWRVSSSTNERRRPNAPWRRRFWPRYRRKETGTKRYM